MASLRLVPYGPLASAALRDAIATAKGDDALAPITVAVPSNYAGLSLRRRLASANGNGRGGIVNVRFYVLPRVAELLGAPALAGAGRRPLTSPVRAEAVRAVLAEDPGPMRDVAQHSSTERSLNATFRDLRHASDGALDTVAARSDRAAHVIRLYRAFRSQTSDYYDEEDLALAAADPARAGAPATRDLGHVVLYLPRRLTPASRAMVSALAETDGLTAILGLTGDADGDATARALAGQLERALGPASDEAPDAIATATQIVATTDAEEEVRSALRLVAERLEGGTPLHRIAVLYASAQPYALIADEQFGAAGIPHNGPAIRSLAQMLSGRTLLGLLRLREGSFRREDVMDWLSAAPILERSRGSFAPAQRWGALSRSAGVVKDASQWLQRLERHLRSLDQRREQLERTDDANEWEIARLTTDATHAEQLSAFIEELAERLAPPRERTWAAFARWARALLERYLGGEGHRDDWPAQELDAHRAVEAALDALSALDDVRPHTDESTFRRALERELDTPAARVGRFGQGVFVGSIGDALGTDFDAVFVLGMSEGMVPSAGRDDPLLPDRERVAAGEELPLRTSRRGDERRNYLAALAAAPERTLIFPRADLRGQRGKLPAQWLLESAGTLEGRTLYSADLDDLGGRPWYKVVASFEDALSGEGASASPQEYDLRSLLRWKKHNKLAQDHYLPAETPQLQAGLSAERERPGDQFTRWDGKLGAPETPPTTRAVSPSSLQHWAACPFRYFLGNVLRVAETEWPEQTFRLSARDRGTLMHSALERFISEATPRTSPDQPWSGDERARLVAIGGELCDEAEAAGITGRPLLWRLDRDRILRDLAGFLNADEVMRTEQGVVPQEVELSFGLQDSEQEAVLVEVDGRRLAFRGRIDRVDGSPDGERLVVFDYKTGSTYPVKDMDKEPTKRGQLLQLPVYALAAQQRFSVDAAAGYYWFVSEKQDYELHGYAVDAAKLDGFRDDVAVIAAGIERGLFPARPGDARDNGGYENCTFCPYDKVCPNTRAGRWERKRGAPELREYVELAEGDE